jgi:hypothetical protein
LSSGIDVHHDRVRFSWQAGGAPNAPLSSPTIAPDGRFDTVTGFTDAMPSVI